MRSLPYFVPEKSEYLNAGILLLIISALGQTKRGKLLLNNERLLFFMYLIKNPVLMSKLLLRLGRPTVALSDEDVFSVSSLAVNLDPLFDYDWIRQLLKHIAGLGLLAAEYKKSDGFLYKLTEEGGAVSDKLTGDYFDKVRDYLNALDPIKSESTSNLNALLNDIFKR